MRLFIGIKVGCIDHLTALQQQLKNTGIGNFTARDNLHITLKFLGEVPSQRVETISDAITQAGGESFTLSCGGLHVMHKGLVVAKVGGETDKLFTLQSRLETALETLGFEKESRPYHPHITLARNYRGKVTPAAPTAQNGCNFLTDETILFESRRENGRLVYVPLFRHRLQH